MSIKDFDALASQAYQNTLANKLPPHLAERSDIQAIFRLGFFGGMKEGARTIIECLSESMNDALFRLMNDLPNLSGKGN